VLERYKGIDTLLEAWREAAPQLPQMQLLIIGAGSRARAVAALTAELRGQVEWTPALSNAEVVGALDASTVLVLPSPMEGMGRVVIEAFARGRPVIGARAGGIADLVQDGVNGILVDPDNPSKLGEALLRVLGDRALAERLGEAAAGSTSEWLLSADEYARRFSSLVQIVAAKPVAAAR
jgi:glycosyltransferase involved in cell wall biosynthesis